MGCSIWFPLESFFRLSSTPPFPLCVDGCTGEDSSAVHGVRYFSQLRSASILWFVFSLEVVFVVR